MRMKEFNLSAWALKHPALMLYTLCALLFSGILSYTQLPQNEDPEFTFRVMSIKLDWPGASASEVEQQLTVPVERALQQTPWLDNLSSYSKAGEAGIYITLKDAMPPAQLEHSWNQVRKELADMRLPDGAAAPVINDHFGQTYPAIYALTSPTLGNAELAKQARIVRDELLDVANVSHVELIGIQPEKIYIDLQSSAEPGIDPWQIASALKAQNEIASSGEINTYLDVIRPRVEGHFDSVKSIQDVSIQAGGKNYLLNDVSHVYRAYADPATFKMRTMGQEAVGIAIALSQQGNVTQLGKDLEQKFARIKKRLPAGIELRQISDQSHVVKKSVSEFMQALLEAFAIVLAVSLLSLGPRAGLVAGLSIPLVLAGTFLLMRLFGIDLQRVSLGALIIALGLLVDDAMIAVEMMKVKLEQGYSKLHAATFAYTSTAWPMLTGTLITAAAFLPVGLAKSSAGEYTFSISVVVTIALLVSWLVAVIYIPFIGFHLLKRNTQPPDDHYRSGFYLRFRRMIEWCLDYRKSVIALTLFAFALAVAGFSRLQQDFFPPSERTELLMDIWLPEGTSFSTTERLTIGLEQDLMNDPNIVNYTSYIGGNTPRFYLPLELGLPAVNYAQIVINTRDIRSRETVLRRMRGLLDKDYAAMGIRIARLENGPPVGFPIQFDVTGKDPEKLRGIAKEIAAVVRKNPHTKNVNQDSSEKIRILNVTLDPQHLESGLSSGLVSRNLRMLLSGLPVTTLNENQNHIEVVERAAQRDDPDTIGQLHIYAGQGKSVSLNQIARISESEEEGIIWHMNRMPVVTVRADVPDHVSAPDVSMEIDRQLAAIRASLPEGYRIEMGGAMAGSNQAQDSIIAILPLMGFIILTLLIFQLKKFKPVALALFTAPLGIIGVTATLLAFRVPFGFVAMLGTISLSGMIMRNSVILLDQISQNAEMGSWDAIVESTVRRLRPIVLTAAAAILAMIPLTHSVFWGPMAIAIMGGLLIATFLTLFFLPALYALWYKAERPGGKAPN
jgi:multidrug efflux pump subunit AcrB